MCSVISNVQRLELIGRAVFTIYIILLFSVYHSRQTLSLSIRNSGDFSVTLSTNYIIIPVGGDK